MHRCVSRMLYSNFGRKLHKTEDFIKMEISPRPKSYLFSFSDLIRCLFFIQFTTEEMSSCFSKDSFMNKMGHFIHYPKNCNYTYVDAYIIIYCVTSLSHVMKIPTLHTCEKHAAQAGQRL